MLFPLGGFLQSLLGEFSTDASLKSLRGEEGRVREESARKRGTEFAEQISAVIPLDSQVYSQEWISDSPEMRQALAVEVVH